MAPAVKPFAALLAKDALAGRGYWIAALGVCGIAAFETAYGEQLREGPFAQATDNATGLGIVVLLFAFAVGHAIVAADFRDGQVEFLDALPARRFGRFVATVVSGLGPLVLFVGGQVGAAAAVLALADGPGDGPWGATLTTLSLLIGAVALLGYGSGLFLSWIGELGWGVFLVAIVVAALAGEMFAPLRPFSPFSESWGVIDVVDGAPSGRTDVAFVWSLAGIVMIALSGLVYLGPGDLIVRAGSRAQGAVRIAAGCALYGLAAATFALFSLIGLFGMSEYAAVEHARTSHFVVSWPTGADRADFARQIEGIDAGVRAYFRTPALPLDIEILGTSRFLEGKFNGGKIRLAPEAGRFTIAHELGHAHIHAIAGDGILDHYDATRFFGEGLADWVAHRAVADPTRLEHTLAQAGVIDATGQADFERLVEDTERTDDFDMSQVYPLGYVFVDSLVRVGGTGAPICVLSHLGEIDDVTIAGRDLWYELAARCRVDLDAVIADYDATLAARGAVYPVLPDPSGRVEGDALRVEDHNHIGWRLRCRFRDLGDRDLQHMTESVARADRCWVPQWQLAADRFEVQLGFDLPDGAGSVFLPWTTIRTQ